MTFLSCVTQRRHAAGICGRRHRLVCGDAGDKTAYQALLGNERADLIFTDPPYNVPIDGHVCGSGRIRHREFAIGAGEMSSAEFTAFLEQTLDPAAEHCLDGAIAFVCMDWRHTAELLAAGKSHICRAEESLRVEQV